MATKPAVAAEKFDGIVDNKALTLPKAALVLFFGLIAWGVIFCGYYLTSGWTSSAELEAKMKAVPSAGTR